MDRNKQQKLLDVVDQCHPLRNVTRLNTIVKLSHSRVWIFLFRMRYQVLTAVRAETVNFWKSHSWMPTFRRYLLLLSLR